MIYPTYKGESTSMWKLIPQKLFLPTRMTRYCCKILKETAGKNSFIVTGVRWDESASRANGRGYMEVLADNKKERIILQNDNTDDRQLFETCNLKAKRAVNPIIDWTNQDVWDFIREENIPYNCLYDRGFSRVGCIGCPLARKRVRTWEFLQFPKYKIMYLKAIERMLQARRDRGLENPIDDAHELFQWWMQNEVVSGQMNLFEGDDLT